GYAFHSPSMREAASNFENYVKKINLKYPKESVKFISTLTGNEETEKLTSINYWVEQIVQPVNYLKAVNTCMEIFPNVSSVSELGVSSTLLN
ncbi:hypothetical protein, partial [Staphylococcus saprophyticus]